MQNPMKHPTPVTSEMQLQTGKLPLLELQLMRLQHGPLFCISIARLMWHGDPPGTGVTILATGIRGARFTGILTMVTILIFTTITMRITVTGIILGTTDTTTIITPASGPIHRE